MRRGGSSNPRAERDGEPRRFGTVGKYHAERGLTTGRQPSGRHTVLLYREAPKRGVASCKRSGPRSVVDAERGVGGTAIRERSKWGAGLLSHVLERVPVCSAPHVGRGHPQALSYRLQSHGRLMMSATSQK